MTSILYSMAVSLLLAVLFFFARNYIKSASENAAKYIFDVKIEKVKSELRQQETQLQADVQRRDDQIAALRSDLLSSHSARISLLDNRRVEAAEKLWRCICALEKLQIPAQILPLINIGEIQKSIQADKEKKMFINAISGGIELKDLNETHELEVEQLFVPDIILKEFDTYRIIIVSSIALIDAIKNNLKNIDKIMKHEKIIKDIVSILPTRKEYVETYGFKTFQYILPEIKNKLLIDIREKMIGMDDTDLILQKSEIVNRINSLSDLNVEISMQKSDSDMPPPPA